MRTRQMHIRLTESEHSFLIRLAGEADEFVNRLVRRLIRAEMIAHRAVAAPDQRENRTTVVHSVLPLPKD